MRENRRENAVSALSDPSSAIRHQPFPSRFLSGQTLSGDGDFTVVGGTDRYKDAAGKFLASFQTSPVPAGANDVFADVTENGDIHAR